MRRVEKIRARAHFNGEYEAPYEPPCRIHLVVSGEQSCQSGTDSCASFWDGPRLRPAYAAQVIGQALEKNTQSTSVRGAYDRPRLRVVTAIDERV